MASSPGYDSFSLPFLRWLKENMNSVYLLSLKKAQVHTIRLKASFLRVFLTCGGKHNNIEDTHLEALLLRIRRVFQSADLDMGRCWADVIKNSSKNSFGRNTEDLLSSVLRSLEHLKPDIHEVYTILSKSSRSTIYGDSGAVMENLNSLLENIEDLLKYNAEMVAPVKEELKAVRKSLRFLRYLLAFTTKRCSKMGRLKDLIIHAEFLADKMSCLLYTCSIDEKMNESRANEMKMHLSSELQNLSPAQRHVKLIYIKALKALKAAQGDSAVADEFDLDSCDSSVGDEFDLHFFEAQGDSAVVDEFDLGFFDSLRDHILELSDTKLSFIASDKDNLLSLHEELRILIISFAMYKPSEALRDRYLYPEYWILAFDQVTNYFLKRISTVIIDMGCLICSLHNNGQNTDKARELKIAVSTLQEYSRQAYDKCIPKSWHLKTKFRTTNAEGMICSLMRILEKIRTQNVPRYSFEKRCIPHHLSKVLQEEMQSLIGAFSNLTAKQHLEHGKLEIQMLRLNHIRNETESIDSSLSVKFRSDWHHNVWLFVLIEEIKEFKCLQDQIMHDTSTSKTMTNYGEIFEDEPERTGEQLINGSKKSYSLPVNVGMRGIDDRNTNLNLMCPQKELKALTLKEGFLEVFLSCKGMWHIEDANLKVLLTRIHSVFQSADQDLQRLQDLEPDVHGAYAILSESSRFITGISDEGLSDEALLKNLNALLENMEVLLKCNTEVVAPLKEKLEAVQKRLIFLRNFLGFTVRSSKLGKLDLLIHSEFLAVRVSCLLYLCCNNEKMNDQTVNEMKMHLSSELQKFRPAKPDVREIYIKALKASNSAKGISNSAVLDEFVSGFLDSLRDDILELSNDNLSLIASNKEQMLSLQQELKFLTAFFTMDKSLEEHSENNEMIIDLEGHIFNSVFENMNAMIIDLGCVIYLLNNDENNEMMAKELNKKVSDLVANFMVAKADIRNMYDFYVPRRLRSDFPRTNGQGYIDSLFQNLNDLLDTKADSVAPLKYHIGIVQKELLSLREDFGKIAEQPSQCDELQGQWTRFLDTAYQTEFIIDSFVIGGDPNYCHKVGLFNVIEEIKTIKIELIASKIKSTTETSVHKLSCFSTQDSEESNFSTKNVVTENTTKLVIFGEEARKIREQLTNGLRKLHIISIVGMPGIGKTTLADSVFRHSSVTYNFHIQARCSVSQVHDKRRLLLEILQQVSKQYSDDDDLDLKLYKSLKGKRFLILLDDIWNIQAWEDIKDSVPDDENGSRILLTSRFEDIASQTVLESTKYHLSPLSEEKCWEMLKEKLFANRSCPSELVMVGREIAANCKGLPLTVDLISGVLRTKEGKEWKEVADSLVTILFEDPQGRCWKVLELSYQNLPDDLKPCFLYFAAFPEDANVPTRDLIFIWIAEGFVELGKDETRSLEDVAEGMLNNLIGRSLITVSERGPLGEVVESGIHDLLHEFSVAKAQEESFMLKIEGKAKFSTLSLVGVLDQWGEQYRLCIQTDPNPNPNYWRHFLKPSGPRTRALVSFDNDWNSRFLNFRTFKLLRVLYIPNAPCGYCPEMFTLIHLRLLSFFIIPDSDARSIISNIHKLWNLETFIMHAILYMAPDENLLLDEMNNMMRLRHFCFEGYIRFRYLREEIWQKASFSNLQTLYNLKASYEEDIEKILKLMPNLVELKALFYNPDGDCYPFPKLDFLKKLKSLEVTHEGGYSFCPCNFPPYLKQLVLSNFQVPWMEISEIGNLEYLEILELKMGSFRGPIWDMIEGQFPKLKYLCLSDLDIEEWNASEDHLSCFEQLHVARCRKLKALPSCLAEICTLQKIKLFQCTKAAENLAKRIKEEQEQMGNEQFSGQCNEDDEDLEDEDHWEDN